MNLNSPIARLLIVDDELHLLKAFCDALSHRGYATVGFDSPEEALNALREEDYDLIFTDLKMPGMDGIEFLRAAKDISPNLVCVMMTGHATIDTAIEAMKAGAFDYILKPFNLPMIQPVILRGLDMKRLRDENIQLRESVSIYELSMAITNTRSFDSILEVFADAVFQQSDGGRVAILLPRENHRELMVSSVRGGHVGEIPQLPIPFDQAIRDWVESYRQAISESNEQEEQRLVSIHPLRNFTDGIAIPMLAAGKLTGILNFAPNGHRHLPTAGQLKTLNILASTAASALAEARMMEHLEQRVAERTRQLEERNRQTEEELKMAHELQLAMLPSRLLNSSQDDRSLVRFHSVYRPAGSVSGDFFDVIELANNRIGVFIGDAMGHDVRAALMTTMMRALVQELSSNLDEPGALMAEVNRYMATILKHSEHVMFATASYLVLDPTESRVLFANAAHPAPIHLKRQQREAVPLCRKGDSGPALGLFNNATYKTGSARLDQSDCFMLFTDGLFEIEAAAGQELYSQERLRHFIAQQIESPAEALVSDLFGELESFSGQASFSDDVCLLAVEMGGTGI